MMNDVIKCLEESCENCPLSSAGLCVDPSCDNCRHLADCPREWFDLSGGYCENWDLA